MAGMKMAKQPGLAQNRIDIAACNVCLPCARASAHARASITREAGRMRRDPGSACPFILSWINDDGHRSYYSCRDAARSGIGLPSRIRYALT